MTPVEAKPKDKVYKSIVQEQNSQLSVTLSGYERFIEQLEKEETLDFFKDEIGNLKMRPINTMVCNPDRKEWYF